MRGVAVGGPLVVGLVEELVVFLPSPDPHFPPVGQRCNDHLYGANGAPWFLHASLFFRLILTRLKRTRGCLKLCLSELPKPLARVDARTAPDGDDCLLSTTFFLRRKNPQGESQRAITLRVSHLKKLSFFDNFTPTCMESEKNTK